MKTWVENSDGLMLVYSIEDAESLDSLKLMLNKIEKIKSKKIAEIPTILVGAKSDTTSRKISTQTASNFAQTYNMLFIETSSATGKLVNEAFEKISQLVAVSTKPENKKTGFFLFRKTPEVSSYLKTVETFQSPVRRKTLKSDHNMVKKPEKESVGVDILDEIENELELENEKEREKQKQREIKVLAKRYLSARSKLLIKFFIVVTPNYEEPDLLFPVNTPIVIIYLFFILFIIFIILFIFVLFI